MVGVEVVALGVAFVASGCGALGAKIIPTYVYIHYNYIMPPNMF